MDNYKEVQATSILYKCSQNLPKVVRSIFILIAIFFVCRAFYKTLLKAKDGNILIKEEVRVAHRYKYPSITFCYKYKHGGKEVLRNYYPHLYKKWKQLGSFVDRNILILISKINISHVFIILRFWIS